MTSLSTQISSRKLDCCCGDNQSKVFRKIVPYQLLVCQSCKLVRLENIYSNPTTFLDDVKKDQGLEYWGFPQFFKKYEFIFNYFFEERYQRILAEKPVSGEWLDIGSGYGFWQKFLENKKQKNFGLEIEAHAVEFAKNSGVDIVHESIENFKTDKKYAVITMCDVLEHVERPDEILQKCRELLLPGGLLYIQVPNVLGFKYPYNDSLGLPHHLWQFDPKTLINLLEREKFILCNYWTGVQGVIRYYELGGPSLFRKSLWNLAKVLKRGNRLQVLVRR